MIMKVKVYSTPSCPWCVRVKEFLKQHKVKFEEIDVSENKKAAMELVMKSGQMGVPVIEVDDKIVVGFDEAKLKKLLKI